MIMRSFLLANAELIHSGIETAVYKHIYTFCRQNPKAAAGYYAASRRKKIDVVLDYAGSRILIDVAYLDSYSPKPGHAIWDLSGQAQSCLIITKQPEDFGPLGSGPEKLYRVPAAAFLYLLGHAEYDNYLHKDRA
jgi:hypothetical protein